VTRYLATLRLKNHKSIEPQRHKGHKEKVGAKLCVRPKNPITNNS
jgi:hypothetical protein